MDRVTFLQNIKVLNSEDENKLMIAIRDGFSHLMACYNLLAPCMNNLDEFKIIACTDDYSSIDIQLSKTLADKINELLLNNSNMLTITVYGEYFNITKPYADEDIITCILSKIKTC